MAAIVGNISVVINYQCDGADEFTESLWGALTSMGYYALAHAASNTKFKVSEDEMRAIFDSRGLDGEYLLSFKKKETATLIYNGMMTSLEQEFEKEGKGCLKRTFDSHRFVKVAKDMEILLEGVLRVISSMSSNKLPYAYHQLIHWAVRNGLFITTLFRYKILGNGHAADGSPYPFECHEKVGDDCHTNEFIWFNALRILLAYFIIGCLELYPTLAKAWENSLVLKNYQRVVDSICCPLKPGTERRCLSQLQLRNKNDSKERTGVDVSQHRK
ncbi:hypothetical protein ACHAWF_001333 [Thalassiosira exigua]